MKAVSGKARSFSHAVLFGIIAAIGCELGARLDDFLFDKTPLLSNPSFQGLFIVDDHGNRRGKPGAFWKNVHMNNVGMRGADVSLPPNPACKRWMFMGASETFGEPSAKDQEFPAQVLQLVKNKHCVEILNSAFPGLHPTEFSKFYNQSLSQYSPDIVFVYPSIHLYLGASPSANGKQSKPSLLQNPPSLSWKEKSRFLSRLKDSVEIPAFIQDRRVNQWITEASANKSKDWMYLEAPSEKLDAVRKDMETLINEIEASGATPVLLTHAIRSLEKPRPDDIADLHAMRVYVPQASENAIAAFEYQAANQIRELGKVTHTKVIDIAELMSGRREKFIDLVHFTTKGHQDIANFIVLEMAIELQ